MMTALHRLYRKIVLASWCPACGSRIGKRCNRPGRKSEQLSVPHPIRQRRAGERFPAIAAAREAERSRRSEGRAESGEWLPGNSGNPRPAPRKLTSRSTRSQIKRLWRDGESLTRLARRSRVARQTVTRVVQEIPEYPAISAARGFSIPSRFVKARGT